jgi:hypothetical protein
MKDLSRSIDKAVAIAVRRHDVAVQAGTLSVNWEIIGRMLRDLADMNTAFKVAADITKGVKVRGIQGQPAVAKIGRDILVGFIERARLPREIGR